MDQKSFVYGFTVLIASAAFGLCIPYPALVGALPAFGTTLAGLFLSYCGGHLGENYFNQKVSVVQTHILADSSSKGKDVP